EADLGITGANFAVADTGTVVLVTNEGNGRMVTSLPRVHVAVMGVEKVVPSMTDLMVFLQILAKSATGQKLPVYTPAVRGPRRRRRLPDPDRHTLDARRAAPRDRRGAHRAVDGASGLRADGEGPREPDPLSLEQAAGAAAAAPVRPRQSDPERAPGLHRVDAHARPSRPRPPDLPRAMAHAEMTTRTEFLSRIRTEVG